MEREKIRVFKDNNGVEIEFEQKRYGNREILIHMYVVVNGHYLATKAFFTDRKRAFRMIKVCENAKENLLLQAVFSELN